MKVLGLIPARGQSKGVPRKNLRLLGGKPLIQWTIDAALSARVLDSVVVSTEDECIRETARAAGALTPFLRPHELAADDTPMVPVVLHALDALTGIGEFYDVVCLLQPTSPFRPMGFIDRAVRLFKDARYDSLVSVLPVPLEYNPHWVFLEDDIGVLRLATGEKSIIPRRQMLPHAWHRDGSVYLTKADILRRKNSFLAGSLGKIVSDPSYAVNIDTEEDWQKAERILITLGSTR